MKLAARLLSAPLLAAAVALSAGIGYAAMLHMHAADARQAAAAHLAHVTTVAQAQDRLWQVHARVYRALAQRRSTDDAAAAAFVRDITQQVASARRAIGGIAEETGDAALKKTVAAAGPLFERYGTQIGQAVERPSVAAGGGVDAMQAADQSHGELAQAMQAIVGRVGALRGMHEAAGREREAQLAVLIATLALLATAGAIGWAWQSQRRIADDIGQAAVLAGQVAGGNLAAQVHSMRHDELGDLVRALGRMAAKLRESIGTVQEATDSITTAAVEIASGNSDLSQRTEQAASNLQRTSSSMMQLTGAVRQSAESAAQANQLAASAAEVARRGGEVVSQVVATMDDINASSRRIADIIGTIDGIAFQTNILALNAAVEAARAGEQGRGFAVVAGEVRNLAQRSATAAREIKDLIGASVDKVESGGRLVRSAGSTMGEIVASVQRVSDIIGEISAAANEQSAGIGQVNQAVAQLDQMTQQNAALVEQSAAAADSLREQASTLGQVVGRFVLGEAAAARPIAMAPAAAAPSRASTEALLRRAQRQARAPARPAPAPARAAIPATENAAAASDDGDWQSF